MKKIRSKLYIVILFILLFNMLATYLFGQTLLKTFYTNNKNRELASYQLQIKNSYLSGSDSMSDQIDEAEKKNITILIFSISGDNATIEYFSRAIMGDPSQEMPMQGDRGRYIPDIWINSAIHNNIISKLDSQADTKTIRSNQSNFSMRPGNIMGNRSLQLYSRIKDKTYLFLETPQEFIAQTADLAVRYILYISMITFVLALILLAFVSKKITKPISNIEDVANKISNLDFNEKCLVESNDELGQLGKSINRMSDTLQENIHRLTVMNAMLREDLDKEEQTSRIRREFIANVSHDFKTPLSLIMAYSEAIRDQENSIPPDAREELVRQCDIIISESSKMDEMVNQLLKLSQLEAKSVTLQESMFDLTSLIEDTIYKHQIMIKAKNINIDFADREECIAFADYIKIGQAFGNLLENAIKYSPANGTVKIWITRDGKYKVHIFNEAENIADIKPEQLFISFYKRDQSRSLEDKSYGLGLAIVKGIIELHGNECGAYKEGEGLVFWFEVKIYKE
ncbi:MAG: sensor histidine kinase [Saccharofermentanales bacterium]